MVATRTRSYEEIIPSSPVENILNMVPNAGQEAPSTDEGQIAEEGQVFANEIVEHFNSFGIISTTESRVGYPTVPPSPAAPASVPSVQPQGQNIPRPGTAFFTPTATGMFNPSSVDLRKLPTLPSLIHPTALVEHFAICEEILNESGCDLAQLRVKVHFHATLTPCPEVAQLCYGSLRQAWVVIRHELIAIFANVNSIRSRAEQLVSKLTFQTSNMHQFVNAARSILQMLPGGYDNTGFVARIFSQVPPALMLKIVERVRAEDPYGDWRTTNYNVLFSYLASAVVNQESVDALRPVTHQRIAVVADSSNQRPSISDKIGKYGNAVFYVRPKIANPDAIKVLKERAAELIMLRSKQSNLPFWVACFNSTSEAKDSFRSASLTEGTDYRVFVTKN